MLQNYLKLALRNLSRQKAFSFINIAGLAVGLASSLIIILWVQDERSFDAFHKKAERTYRLTAAASDLRVAITPAPLGPALEEMLPEIEESVRIRFWSGSSSMLQAGENKFEEQKVAYTEPSFFEVFDFKLLYGDSKTALKEPNGVIISEDLARKYFGTTDALGKSITKDNIDQFTVTGVLAKSPGNSHLQFDALLPWSYIATSDHNIKDNSWSNFDFYTYITFHQPLTKESILSVENRIDTLYAGHEGRLQVAFSLQPLLDIHLHSNFMGDIAGHGNAQYVSVFSIIAVFIVLIGCINFMNLSTARSARRAKEVGLRKVAGAVRVQLIKQFLGESLLITAIAFALAVIIAIACLPLANDLVGKQLSINFYDPFTITALVCVTLVTGLIAGVYPAFYLSGFTPIKVLKKEVTSRSGGATFRNVLVVSQFVISIVLLVGTAVVFQQLNYIQKKDLGFDKENLIHVTLHGNIWETLNTWRSAFEANPLTANVTIASGLPTNHVSGTSSLEWQGKDPDKQVMFAHLFIDDNFVPIYGMKLVAGRNFNEDLRGDSSNFLVNETAAKVMGWTPESALGQQLNLWDQRKGEIVGVVKDFNFKPLHNTIEPLVMTGNQWGAMAVVRAQPNTTAATIAAMEEIWHRLDNVYPFTYNFVDQNLANLYKSEKQAGTLFTVFASLAIIISCLGLYGLSAYIAEQRTREIGIRKSLGASVLNILYLLNTRFVVPVLVAMVIAAPLAYYGMNQWLESFAYRVSFNWVIVLVAGLIALSISLLTVTYESLKAAKVNPVASLRAE